MTGIFYNQGFTKMTHSNFQSNAMKSVFRRSITGKGGYILWISWVCFFSLVLATQADQRTIDFSREILPLLSDACFQCHGPDPKARKGNLRLDVEESAKKYDEGEMAVIAPGKPGESELIRRLLTEDEDDLMPPAEIGRPLTESQVDLLRKWIAQGAQW